MELMLYNINAVCEKFNLQLKQVYKKIHSISLQNKRGYRPVTTLI